MYILLLKEGGATRYKTKIFGASNYPTSTLANSTLIILFSKMPKISKIIRSKSKDIVK
jgi:hypothetical protein